MGKPLFIPERQLAIGLELEPAPSQLDGKSPRRSEPIFPDSLFSPAIATVERSRCQSNQLAHLLSILKRSPAEEFARESPGSVLSDSVERKEFARLHRHGALAPRDLSSANRLEPLELVLDSKESLIFELDPLPKSSEPSQRRWPTPTPPSTNNRAARRGPASRIRLLPLIRRLWAVRFFPIQPYNAPSRPKNPLD